MDPLTAFGTVVNVAGLADVAFRVMKDVLEYYHEVKSAPEKSQKLQEELFAISNVARNMKDFLSRCPSDRSTLLPVESVSQFGELLEEMKKRTELPERNLMKRLKWPFSVKENNVYIARLERLKSIFTLAFEVCQR
jgi:hypothetical protein